jgi:hypothetical protein
VAAAIPEEPVTRRTCFICSIGCPLVYYVTSDFIPLANEVYRNSSIQINV